MPLERSPRSASSPFLFLRICGKMTYHFLSRGIGPFYPPATRSDTYAGFRAVA